jgi:ABC-type nitrate/sulfonate/bicarbonate transport system substrate-binding protein
MRIHSLCVIIAVGLSMITSAVAAPLRDVSIALGSVGFGTAPVPLAQQLGLFETHGIRARLIVMDSGSAASIALISRSVDVALAGAGEFVAALGRGQNIVMIASVYKGSAGTLVLSKQAVEKLGVSPAAPAAARLKALDGILIASPSAVSGYTASIKGAAASIGANIRIVYMAPTAMASALDAGAVQGIIAGAPSWAPPVVKGTGVTWLSGPRQDFPTQNVPVNQGSLQVQADFARSNPDLMRNLAAVMSDFAKAVEERPMEVRAALAKVYPNLDKATLDLLFDSEASAWKTSPVTPADVQHDISFVKLSGIDLPKIDSIDPAAVVFKSPE